MTRLDPRAPLVFDMRDLRRRPGSYHESSRTVVTPEPLGTDVVALPAGTPVELDLRAEAVSEGVLMSGSARGTARGICVRCLETVSVPVAVTFQELFVYADRAAHHHEVAPDDDEDEVFEMVGDLIDLEPMLRDTIVPALPFQPVCRADCPGLCSECGARLTDDPGHRHDLIDPRWSALSTLLTAAPETEEKRN
jgi:uncharacterized protein